MGFQPYMPEVQNEIRFLESSAFTLFSMVFNVFPTLFEVTLVAAA